MSPKADSGVQPDGRYVPAFQGQRPPFGDGNALALKHGAYSAVALSEKAAEIEGFFRDDFQAAVDEEMFRTVVEAAAQVRLGFAAMARVGDNPKARLAHVALSKEARSWVRCLMDVLDKVAATPQARSEVASRLARAGIGLRLSPDERAELDRLEAMTTNGDLLTLFDIRDRVRLRDLRGRARGD